MIIIDPSKNALATGSLKKISKKELGKTKFKRPINTVQAAGTSEGADNVSVINPFLFLQEVDEYQEDQDKLKEGGNKILKSLNEIRFGLINGELQEQNILKLKSTLEANRMEFKFPELQDVIDDIILRSEVELAKIEVNRKH